MLKIWKTNLITKFFVVYPLLKTLTGRQRSIDNEASDSYAIVDTSALIQIIFCLIGGIILFRILKKEKDTYNNVKHFILNTPLKFLLIYNIICFISGIWSINQALTFYRGFECLVFTLLIITCLCQILVKNSYTGLINWLIDYVIYYFFIAILSDLYFKGTVPYAPQFGVTILFYMGIYCCKNWLKKWIIITGSLLSFSTISYIGIFIGFWGIFLKHKFYKSLLALFVVGVTICSYTGVINVMEVLGKTIFFEKGVVASNATSGRDEITELLLNSFEEKPLLGYGFVSGETHIIKVLWGRSHIYSSHNGFLSALTGTGITGTVFFTIFICQIVYISLFSPKIRNNQRPYIWGICAVAFMHTIGNPSVGGSVAGSAWLFPMFAFAFICITFYCAIYHNFSRIHHSR
jgi:hypothetical protein